MSTNMTDGSSVVEKKNNRWPPIESNPDVMNRLAKDLGLPEQWAFTDVFGLDDDLLAMLPSPVIALILLFPSSQKSPVDETKRKVDSEGNIFFLRQVDELDDACGTIAMVHAVSNNLQKLSVSSTGILKAYINRALGLDPYNRGMDLANDKTISQLHGSFASQGQTAGIPEGQSSNHHFVCLTEINGDVYELDGCKPFPINHGSPSKILGETGAASSPFPFLSSAARVIQETYLKDPSVIDFSIIALAAQSDD